MTDDLNKKRGEKGANLSFHNKSGDEIEADIIEWYKARGIEGQTLSWVSNNAKVKYQVRKWRKFGESSGHLDLEPLGKALGYTLVGFEVYTYGAMLYFGVDNVGIPIRMIMEEGDPEIYIDRSEPLEDSEDLLSNGFVDAMEPVGLHPIAPLLGETLDAVLRTDTNKTGLIFGDKALVWDDSYDLKATLTGKVVFHASALRG